MDKIIIMGLGQSGKTTIIRNASEGYVPPKKAPYNATIEYKRKTYTIFGKKISLFDLGGQKSFLDRFVGNLAEFIFSNVANLIYVIDLTAASELSLAKYYFDLAYTKLNEYSPNAKISFLFHKTDLIDRTKLPSYIESIETFFEFGDKKNIVKYESSVYDDSTTKIFEQIVSKLSDEPKSIKIIAENYYLKNKQNIETILLLDEEKNPIFLSEENQEINIQYLDILRTLETVYNESIKYSLTHFQSKLIFSSLLPNKVFLSITYKINQLEAIDNISLDIVTKSLKFLDEIIAFI